MVDQLWNGKDSELSWNVKVKELETMLKEFMEKISTKLSDLEAC